MIEALVSAVVFGVVLGMVLEQPWRRLWAPPQQERPMSETTAFFESLGYYAVRQLPTGVWVGVTRFMYTNGLCVGLEETGYQYRYCYERFDQACFAANCWDGQGDPPGPWLKLKGAGDGDRQGPGWDEYARRQGG